MNNAEKLKYDDSTQDKETKDLNEQCYEHVARKVKTLLSDNLKKMRHTLSFKLDFFNHHLVMI